MASLSEMLQYATMNRDQNVANASRDPWASSAMDIIGGMQQGKKDFKANQAAKLEQQMNLLKIIEMGNKIQQQEQEIMKSKRQIELMDMSRYGALGDEPQKVGKDGQLSKNTLFKSDKLSDYFNMYDNVQTTITDGKVTFKEILPDKAKQPKILTPAEKEIQRNKIIEGYNKNIQNILKSGGAIYRGEIDPDAITLSMEEAMLIEENKIRKLNGLLPITPESPPEEKENFIFKILNWFKKKAKESVNEVIGKKQRKDSLGILGD